MDISKTISELVDKISLNDDLLADFKKNAKATVKKLIKADVPEETIDAAVTAIKAKLMKHDVGDLTDKLSGLLEKK